MAEDLATPTDVAVVGGGAVGLTAGSRLAARGIDVTLYERDELGSGATGRAAGLCYDAYADRTDASVAAQSLERFRDLGVLTECPYVWVARDGDDHTAAAIEEQVSLMRERGREVQLVSPTELGEQFPGLQTDHLDVAAIAHNAGYVDPDAYVERIAAQARDAGAELETGEAVTPTSATTLRTATGNREFDAVLLAAGTQTGRLAGAAGHTLALGWYRAQALVAEAVSPTPPLYYDASERFYLRPHGTGLLAGDGAHPGSGGPDDAALTADDSFVEQTLERIETALGVTPGVDSAWAGRCTATPDRNPLLGSCSDGLFVAAGWHGHGLMRAPAHGRRVADQLLGGAGIAHFAPTRFDGSEEIDLPAGIID